MTTRRTIRCDHGFAKNIPDIRCLECHPPLRGDERDESSAPTRRAPGFRFAIGAVIAGAQIVGRLSNDRIDCICECGERYDISRSAVARHHKAGTTSRCWPCQKREMRKMLDERRGVAAE